MKLWTTIFSRVGMFRKVIFRWRSGKVGPPRGFRNGLPLWYGEESSQDLRRCPTGPGSFPGG